MSIFSSNQFCCESNRYVCLDVFVLMLCLAGMIYRRMNRLQIWEASMYDWACSSIFIHSYVSIPHFIFLTSLLLEKIYFHSGLQGFPGSFSPREVIEDGRCVNWHKGWARGRLMALVRIHTGYFCFLWWHNFFHSCWLSFSAGKTYVCHFFFFLLFLFLFFVFSFWAFTLWLSYVTTS